MLSILIWLPAAAALIGAIAGGERAGGALHAARARSARSAIAIALIAGYNGNGGAAHARHRRRLDPLARDPLQDRRRRPEPVPGRDDDARVLALAARRQPALVGASPSLFYLLLGVAESAVLGAFLAQDLALFVALLRPDADPLLPADRRLGRARARRRDDEARDLHARRLAADARRRGRARRAERAAERPRRSTSPTRRSRRRRSAGGTQDWIFLLFAAAFLVKMPAFPLHGWMPDGYREMPIEVLAIFSGVLSKVGAYGFLAIVLPLMPRRQRPLPDADAA